ncbi:MAG TPA: YcgL domain-containing protein [Chromatiales bacterium]|nr:YcgL domain-containing protein [Chromatiales bacterium]
MKCFVYRSRRRPDAYLFVPARDDFSEVPDGLLELFGRMELALELELSPRRRLAAAEASEVLRCLREQGYFLQMPPQHGRMM